MEPVQTFETDVRRRLTRVRNGMHRVAITHGAVVAGLALLALTVAVLIVESVFRPGIPVRSALFWTVIAASLMAFLLNAGPSLLRLVRVLPDETDEATAARVGRSLPAVRDRLQNALQLHRELQQPSGAYSVDLITGALRDVERDISPIDFTSTISHAAVVRRVRMLLGAAALAALAVVVLPGPLLESAYRLLHHGEAFASNSDGRLIVHPGSLDVLKGTDVPIVVDVRGGTGNGVVLESRPEGQTVPEMRALERGGDGLYRYTFTALKATTRYRVRAGEAESDEYALTVRDRPMVRLLRVALTPPPYTGLPPRQLDDNIGDISALVGTRASFLVEAGKPLATARLRFSDGNEFPLAVERTQARGALTLRRGGSYTILLADATGAENSDPIEYTIRLVADAPPTAAIPLPGTNVTVVQDTALAMMFALKDDFGFSRLRLAYRLAASRYEKPAEAFTVRSIPLPALRATELTIPFIWSLEPFALAPEDVLEYYIEVLDNDAVSGPKSAVSPSYTIRVPSLNEVVEANDRTQAASMEGMKEAMRRADEARKDLEELRRDLSKETQKLDWKEQQRAEELLKKLEQAQEAVSQAAEMAAQATEEMQKSGMLSQETLQKYQELQQLMEQINSPELAEAMKRLQESMQQMNPELMRQALQQMTVNEETFRKSLERTINLLKRLQLEQKVDEMVRRADELAKAQEDLNQKTAKADSSNRNEMGDLAERQKDLREDAARMKEQLADLQQKMQEFPKEMPLDEAAQAMQEMKESGMEERLQESTEALQQQELAQAMQAQQSASGAMRKMQKSMSRMRDAMRANQQQQIVNEMRRALEDLLELSERQEALRNESRSLDPGSQAFREQAQRQMDIARDLSNVTDRMAGLSQKTFAISPEMGKAIGDAMRSMGNAVDALDERNGQAAGGHESGAMASLNEAARMMQGSLGAMMQGSQGMGMAGLMQRLQQMSGQQQSINQGTRESQGMSQQQAAEMARLAGEQGMVRKSLEQLAREAAASGALSRMLGDLQRIAQDMREVQTDLAQGNVNPETLRKQERILSRLLDSQRSMRERDYEQRRRAESGRTIRRAGPAELDPSTREGRDQLRRDLLKALEEGYARDYEALIRKYFELLEQ
jgi:hypothetical protein